MTMKRLLSLIVSALVALTANAQNVRINEGPAFGEITIGSTIVGGGTAGQVLFVGTGPVLSGTSKITLPQPDVAGQGPSIVAGTAATNVAALSVTRTNNDTSVVKGVEIVYTDTSSASTFLPLSILGGAGGATNLLKVAKDGTVTAGTYFEAPAATGFYWTGRTTLLAPADSVLQIANNAGNTSAYLSPAAAGVLAVGTGAAGSTAGTVAATDYRVAAVPIVRGTAPTLASGGCTTPTAVTGGGTAAFSVGVGTSCSGSQPLVFTLPAATTGWTCNARNITNGATSAPAQTGAVSTTSVTITNFVRTTGVAGAWTDSDVVAVTCLGY